MSPVPEAVVLGVDMQGPDGRLLVPPAPRVRKLLSLERLIGRHLILVASVPRRHRARAEAWAQLNHIPFDEVRVLPGTAAALLAGIGDEFDVVHAYGSVPEITALQDEGVDVTVLPDRATA